MAVRSERDYLSFEQLSPEEWARRVKGTGLSVLAGIDWDAVSATYPSNTTEIYAFKTGGLSGTVVATVTIVYTNASKDDVLSIERT